MGTAAGQSHALPAASAPEHITQLDRLAIVENSGKVIRNYLMEYIEDWSVSGTYFGHKPIEITLLITA